MKKNKIALRKIYSKIAALLIIVLLVLLVFKILSDGIRINSVSIAGINIDGLYLKLNKKLILEIDNISLGKFGGDLDSTPSIAEIAGLVKRVIWLVSFFEHLEISNIQYQDSSSSIFFDGKHYEVHTPYLLMAFELENSNDDILLHIDTLRVKKDELDVKGEVLYVKENDTFAFDLQSYINNRLDNTISFQGQTDFKHLNIVLESTTLNSIHIFAPYIKILDSDVYEWIYERASFDKVTINRAYINIDKIKSSQIEKQIVDNLYANGVVENVNLKFDDNLPAVSSKQVAVLFDKGKLSFQTNGANYEGIVASQAQVDISNFLDPQTLLQLNIHTKEAMLDSRILGILNNYDISLPIIQKSGVGSGFVNLDILLPSQFKGQALEAKVTPNGFFNLKNADIAINDIDIFVSNADITIKGDSILIHNANAKFSDIIDTSAELHIDTLHKTIDLVATPQYFKLKNEQIDIIDLSHQRLHAKIDFSTDSVLVKFDDLDIDMNISETINVSLNNLANIAPYSPILRLLDITNGNLHFNFVDTKYINLEANIYNLKYPIYRLNGSQINSLHIVGNLSDDSLILRDNLNKISSKISLSHGSVNINASEVMVDIDKIFQSKIPIFAKSGDSSTSNINVSINGNHIKVALFGYNINLNEAIFQTTNDGFSAVGKAYNGIANIQSKQNVINIEAHNFNDKFVNTMFSRDIVSGGTFGLVGIYKDDKFLGQITMAKTSIKDMASLQNILTLIDTIPSLVVFKLPGFSTSGYEIDDALIRIGINSEFIALEKININGSSVDVEGQGVVDLITKEININLTLSTMKSLSSILNKIPIVGYLLLGDDGKITTEIAITGTMDKPQTDLSLLEDTMNAPVNIFKRIFAPFQRLSDELEKESREKGHR